jgi:uncharacterized membrane protein
MIRTGLSVLAGLLLAAGVHIGTVLSVPLFAVDDAWARTAELGADGTFRLLGPAAFGQAGTWHDPHFVEAVCRFDLSEGPLRIQAMLPETYWSVAVLDRRGRNVYSLDDRAGDPVRLDLAIMAPDDLAALGEERIAAMPTTVFAALPADLGMAVLRVFVLDEPSRPEATAALTTADCGATL